MSVAEMKMLRWISGMTREGRIGNEYVRKSIRADLIMDKMKENILRWFDHLTRRVFESSKNDYRIEYGRKKTNKEVIEHD